jgi:hypothetical protein
MALKESNQEMNAAYAATYAPSRPSLASQTNSAPSGPEHSPEPKTHEEEAQKPKTHETLWKRVKTVAMRHHKDVQTECDHIYGTDVAMEPTRDEVNPCKVLPAGI